MISSFHPCHSATAGTLQHTATHCNTRLPHFILLIQGVSIEGVHLREHNVCNTLQRVQHTATCATAICATHCNVYNTLQRVQHTATCATHYNVCNTMQCAQHTATRATHCNALQHTGTCATHCNTLQHAQHTVTRCNTLQNA